MAGVAVLIPAAIIKAGGWNQLVTALPAGSLNPFAKDAWLFVWAFFWVMSLSMWVAADIYQLLFSAKSVRSAKIGLGFAGFFMIIMGLAAAFIGTGASVIFPNLADPDAAMPTLAATLVPGLRGFVAIAMLGGSAIAVVMFQIVSSTLLVRGIWPQKQLPLNRIRLLSALMGVLGLVFAGLLPNIISLTELTFRIIIPATFVPVMAAFYWKRANAAGALASSLFGVISSVLWTYLALPHLSDKLQLILEPAFIGVAVSFISMVIASYAAKPPLPEKWQLFRAH